MSNQILNEKSEKIDLSVVIVSWNVAHLLKENLTRLFSLSCPYRFEVFVVDNGSSDGSAKLVREQFSQVHLIQNDWDSGFSFANNQALRLCRGEVILLLNPDMLVNDGSLEKTVEILIGDKTIGVLGIRLNNHHEKPIQNVRRFPDFFSQFLILIKLNHLFPKLLNHYLYHDFDYEKSQEVDQVRGSYFAFRRELLKTVGYLDEAFHIWFEEVDYCKRAKAKGMKIWYESSVSAHDYVGKGMELMKHLEKQLIFTHSMIHYFKKYHPIWQWILLFCFRPVGLFFALLADIKNSFKKFLFRI